jgi:uncharacterized protein (DUF362 family)
MKRREFIELAGLACGTVIAGGCGGGTAPVEQARKAATANEDRGRVFVGNNVDPVAALQAAMSAAGGLRFIAPGSHVVLKPNAAWSRGPQQAADTDPLLVAAMIRMCRDAGAAKITVFEHTIDRPSAQVLAVSGIGAAARDAGAELLYASSERDFAPIDVPKGKLLHRDTLAKVVLEADVLINMPKAKHHSQTRLTLGLKNLMGVVFDRQAWHSGPDLHQYIADYATAVPVDLTVMDASRILLTNGPKGPGKTREPHEVIVSFDPVAVDAYACRLFELAPADIGYIVKAAELGLGESDPAKIDVKRV